MFSEIFTEGLGWLYLKTRYKTNAAMQLALKEKYDGSYSAAVGVLAVKVFAVILMILIALLMIALIVGLFRFGIT